MKKFRNKIFPTLIALVISFSAFADDLKVADDFKKGDLLSSDTFNQIFDTLEEINRTVKEDDIFGTWNCSSIASRLLPPTSEVDGWVKKGFLWELSSSQVNFKAPIGMGGTTQSQSAENTVKYPANVSTSSPSPFFVINDSSSGTYSVYNGMLFIKGVSGSNPGIVDENWVDVYEIDLISTDRMSLTNRYSTTTGIPKYLICDISAAVPASPSNPSASNSLGTVTINWMDNSENEDGFRIYRKKSSDEEYVLVDTVTTNSYIDSNITEGQGYNYYITSFNANGESLKSKIILITPDSTPPTITLVNPASGSSLTQLNDFKDQGTSETIFLTFSELSTFFSNDRTGFWPISLFINDVEIDPSNAWAPRPLVPDPIHNSISFGMVLNDYGDYKIIVHKDGIVDKSGNQMSEDLTIIYSVSQN